MTTLFGSVRIIATIYGPKYGTILVDDPESIEISFPVIDSRCSRSSNLLAMALNRVLPRSSQIKQLNLVIVAPNRLQGSINGKKLDVEITQSKQDITKALSKRLSSLLAVGLRSGLVRNVSLWNNHRSHRYTLGILRILFNEANDMIIQYHRR